MRQRVKMAQAIAHDPDSADSRRAAFRQWTRSRGAEIRMIRDWAGAGKSVIVSSHILHEIESMDREHPPDQSGPDSG